MRDDSSKPLHHGTIEQMTRNPNTPEANFTTGLILFVVGGVVWIAVKAVGWLTG